MNHDAYDDAYITDVLASCRSVAVVGASANANRPSYFVIKYLVSKGYRVVPVNPGLAGQQIQGLAVAASLDEIGEPIDMVDIFRNSEAALEITGDAIRLRDKLAIKVVWMQLSVRNDEAAALAEAAGLRVVMNRCPKIEYGRLSGEIGWAGVNPGIISSQRPKLSASGVQSHILARKGE